MDPCDVVRDVYFWVRPKRERHYEGGVYRTPPDKSKILFVHSWRRHELPAESRSYYRRVSDIEADHGDMIPFEYCEVPQEGVPLYLAKILGLSTMEEEHHEDNLGAKKAQVEALNNIAEATYDVADATRYAGHSVGKAIAMPNHWGRL